MEKKKNSRARAPEKKAAQFEKILDAGKELFVKYGTYGLSLRALAKRLNMSQTNLYNYVESKRELWIAIRRKYYNEFQEALNEVINKHQGSYIDLFIKLTEFFLEFASADYHRFAIMFLISAPPSSEIGPFEKAYKPFQIMEFMSKIVEKAVKAKEIPETNAIETLYYIYGLILGVAKVEADLKLHLNITEPIKIKSYSLSGKNFRKHVLKQIQDILHGIAL